MCKEIGANDPAMGKPQPGTFVDCGFGKCGHCTFAGGPNTIIQAFAVSDQHAYVMTWFSLPQDEADTEEALRIMLGLKEAPPSP